MEKKATCIADVKRICKEEGNHFFDKETIDFWASRVESKLYQNGCFVTSEDNFDRTKRLYTVRRFDPECESYGDLILTASAFQQFESLEEAKKFAESYKA